MYSYYLHLGSNQGDRKEKIDSALQAISDKIGPITAQSSVYETEPWGMKEQDNFLNMALLVTSTKDVEEVFHVTKSIESALGNNKKEKWGPRDIDIDILYFDDKIIDSESLKIPHPQLYNRNFVLVPMIEIAGDFVDPVKKISLDEIYDMCEDEGEVFLYEA